jgi:HD-GYP domain-containing protein (c-di-GMP phosphodiesterase class II)/DNA-binding CsgD family transcriptional regulator
VAGELRLAELVCSISLATDLGTGQPMEHALRTCVLSQRAADALGLEPAERRELYYVALLRFLGCTSGAAKDAELSGGSEIDFYAGVAPVLMGRQTEILAWLVRHLGEGRPTLARARLVVAALADTGGMDRDLAEHCEAGQRLARRLGVENEVVTALGFAFERWDGKGHPNRVPGERIPVSVRISLVARDVELLERIGGLELVRETLSSRSSRAYDPRVAEAFLDSGSDWLAEVRDAPAWESTLEAEPFPHATVSSERLEDVLAAFADFVDLKSPYLHGHSSGVAEIVGAAGEALGLDRESLRRLRLAALVHDLGRVGVSSAVWDRRGSLSTDDWERVRLHPYLSERVLARCSLWSDLSAACAHHERLDGSGYHRGLSASALSPGERLLAAADAYQAMTQQRPHRPARSPAEAVAELSREVDAGRLDARCVQAVAEVAGHPRSDLERWPDGLTDREVDVLRLIAKGKSNKEVAAELVITPKTVGHHVEHIYAKIGVRTRAGAALYTMERGLVA